MHQRPQHCVEVCGQCLDDGVGFWKDFCSDGGLCLLVVAAGGSHSAEAVLADRRPVCGRKVVVLAACAPAAPVCHAGVDGHGPLLLARDASWRWAFGDCAELVVSSDGSGGRWVRELVRFAVVVSVNALVSALACQIPPTC